MHRVPRTSPGLHASRRAAFHENTLGARADEDAGAGGIGVEEPGLHGGLLGAESAAVGAVTAAQALVAPAHVARLRILVPAEPGEALVNELLAAGAAIVIEVDADPLADDVEALRERVGSECREPVARPLLPHLVGSPERRRVVDDRPAAETGPGEDPDCLVVRRRGGVAEVAPVALELGAVEIRIVVVRPCLEHDHVQARAGQDGCGRPSARARSDDADIAVELEIAGHRERFDRLRRRLVDRADRPGVADAVPGRVRRPARSRQPVREGERGLAEAVERRSARHQPAVAPGEQDPLAALLRQSVEPPHPEEAQ